MPFNDVASLREGLKTVALGEDGLVPVTAGKVAFAYAGKDSHQAGMGRSLYETEPVVRAVLDRCDEVFRENARRLAVGGHDQDSGIRRRL